MLHVNIFMACGMWITLFKAVASVSVLNIVCLSVSVCFMWFICALQKKSFLFAKKFLSVRKKCTLTRLAGCISV